MFQSFNILLSLYKCHLMFTYLTKGRTGILTDLYLAKFKFILWTKYCHNANLSWTFWVIDFVCVSNPERTYFHCTIMHIFILWFVIYLYSYLWFNFLYVSELPQKGPTLYVNQKKFDPGDYLKANCSSIPSKPVATLSFLLNNVAVSILL